MNPRRKYIILTVQIISLIVSGVWLYNDTEKYEPLILVIGLIGTIITTIFYESKKEDKDEKPTVIEKEPEEVSPENLTNIDPEDGEFVGREKDIEELLELIVGRKKRIVSILGTGGLGKTRLAKELGYKLIKDFSGGVWFADLNESKTENGIAKVIHEIFGQHLSSSQIQPADAVVELLKDKGKILLILDNFEQIVELADESISYWVKKLPSVSFLITSRAALKIKNEQQFRLDLINTLPKTENDFNIISKNDSVKLFLGRAKQLRRNFSITPDNAKYINSICNRLEGLPLAIELAASRIKIQSAKDISESLQNQLSLKDDVQDRDKRHSTLEKAITWSFDLLTKVEQEAFLQTAIFKDGFSLEAAKKILTFPPVLGKIDIEEVIGNLVENSLLRTTTKRDTVRFDMFVAVEEFAELHLTKLKGHGYYKDLVDRWADYYVPFIIENNKFLRTKDGNSSLDKTDDELENIFGIQEEYIKLNQPEKAAKAILVFSETMSSRGPALLRVPRLMLSYDAFENKEHGYVGKLALELSKAHLDKGEWNEGELFADVAVNVARKIGDKKDLANSLMQQGKMMKERGYLNRSIYILRKAENLFYEIDNSDNAAVCLTFIAAAQERLGNFKESLKTFQKAENIADANSDLLQKGMIYNRRGLAYWHHGDVKEALKSIKKSQEFSKDAGNRMWVPAHITNTGLYLGDLDRFEEAIECFKKADVIHKEMGTLHWAAVNYGGWGRTLLMRSRGNDIDESVRLLKKAEEFSRKIYYPENIAFHIGDLGRAYFIKEKWLEAFNNISEAVALERRMGANNEHRHFCNLVILAATSEKLNKKDLLWESLVRALHLQQELKIDERHQIRKVREDRLKLIELVSNWKKNYPNEESLNYNGIFKSTVLNPPDVISNIYLSNKRAFELLDKIHDALEVTGYEYPWYSLEEELKEEGKDKIVLFGYGSLLNKLSAKETIKNDAVDKYTPVIAFGIKRLLDYNMPDELRSRSIYEFIENEQSIGLFNARFTGSITDSANGALIEVSLDEIASLRKREVGYDLRPIVCIPWGNQKGKIMNAYTLGCSGRMWKGKMLSDSTILPHKGYYKVCREGASKISNKFLEYFLETSYIADGKTKVKDWEKTINLNEE